ncbi:unnamed protein product [Moneuplotes crassus]|uniref:Uncharacterized protein n=1 Tax=Euplotes crassus TaxID=5936 RepID=A0AAD1X7U7_EUPCR|nr:unnamed protein product [Moneuplotes crassus]
MDRFKGKTTQMNKEGHLGIVHSTKQPVKPLKAYPNDSYKNEDSAPYGDLSKSRDYGNLGSRGNRSKSNYEALSATKSMNNSSYTMPSLSQENKYSFASNFKKNHKAIDDCYNEAPSLQRRMQAAGNNVMRYSSSSNFGINDNMISRTSSLQPAKDSLGFQNNFQTPQKRGHLHHYGQMSASLQRFNEDQSSFKGSFYSSRSAKVMNSSSYSMGAAQPYMSYSNQSSYMNKPGYAFGTSIASNSTGFYPTAVSTPAYDKNNENISIRSKAEEMMKRTEELSRITKPGKVMNDISSVRRKLDMNSGESYFRKYKKAKLNPSYKGSNIRRHLSEN